MTERIQGKLHEAKLQIFLFAAGEKVPLSCNPIPTGIEAFFTPTMHPLFVVRRSWQLLTSWYAFFQ
ncbi:hypothetical protein [Pseudomonas fluorescens]|uniref:hypothetical protein n=1 Tax=Pseudomonas fluorescens TaxID=294 RepID=UPI0012417885|nr:hypothetical protein [Pseudomonas fluorescens]